MNPLNLDDSYHVDIIRTKLTRNIADIFKDVRDELVRSLDASIPTSGDGAWQISIPRRDSSYSCGIQSGSKFLSWKLCNVQFVRPQIVCLWGLRCVRDISSI